MAAPAPAPSIAPERGFTLVEIIVAATIAMVVAAMVFVILLQGRKSADHAIAGEAAAKQTETIATTLTSDVRSARAPGRDDVDDPIELADLVSAGADEVADVLVAGPDELKLRTRARAATTYSCVWWRRDAAGVVTRSIHPDLACTGPASRTERMGVVPRTATTTQPGVPQLFAYGVLRDLDPASNDPKLCTTDETSQPATRGAIIAIGVRLDLNADRGQSKRRQQSTDMTSIRSRDEPAYRAALGCAW
jgi:hypothetical protein